MGFKDVEWAYTAGRPLAETSVLAALCLRTDDKTHQTFVGQNTLAEMLGASPEKVMRTLGVLERAGVITRARRNGPGGYRTSDLITVNVSTYQAKRLPGESPTRQNAYQENRRDLGDYSSPPTRQKVTAEEITQIDHSEDHPVIPADRFEEFYEAYPRKAKRPDAQRAWEKSIKRADADHIIRRATAYRDNPIPEHKKTFIPYPATWLNGDMFNDPLPDWYAAEKPTPTSRALGVMQAGQQLINARQAGLAAVTTLNPRREIS
jgi:DNA-binding Lrp family transcriptional regulator